MKEDHATGITGVLQRAVFGMRVPLLLLFLAVTVVLAYFASQLQVDAGFKKQLPLEHEYMQTFLEYEEEFGSANRLLVAVMAKDGDMFDDDFFATLESVTNEVFFIPGVNRPSVKSIFTPNVRFVEIVEDGFAGGNVIPSDFAPSPAAFERVRGNIQKAGVVGRLVAEEFDGAMVWADLMETNPQTGETIDYNDVADKLEQIRSQYQDEDVTIHIIGFAKIVGDITEGAKSVIYFFGIAILITALLLLWYSRSIKLTGLVLLCSIIAVIWQLGLLRVLGFGIDPMNILTPFLIFAIGVSHGVQMINAWLGEVLFGRFSTEVRGDEAGEPVDGLTAAKRTFARLLAPGAIALLSDTIGFLTILLIEIRIIQELAITASIGVALIILTNLILLPILLSYTRLGGLDKRRRNAADSAGGHGGFWGVLASFTNRGVATVTILVAAVLFGFGYIKSQDMKIGDSEAGVPELRADSRYNQDAALIADRFALSTDSISIIAEVVDQSIDPAPYVIDEARERPDLIGSACTESYEAMELIDRFAWNMENLAGVQKVITLPDVAKTINSGWNEGNLKWRILPRNNFVMRQNLANVDTSTGLLNQNCSAMPVIVFLEDHKAETITRVVDAVKAFREERAGDAVSFTVVNPDTGEEIEDATVQFRLATGNAGVMAATNEVVAAAQMPMLLGVYGAIILLCLITFRSPMGTVCIIAPLALVSVLAYALMAYMGIGLKVNTLPVVALGVGIGVDYGIYIFSRLKAGLDDGASLHDAYLLALRQTGKPVLFTAFTLAIGVGTWFFSDLQFQADMGILLAFMFLLNMVGAVLIMPALARWLMRPTEQVATSVYRYV